MTASRAAAWTMLVVCLRSAAAAAGGRDIAAFMNAAYRGRSDAVRELLAAGADANTKDKYGVTALSLAVSQGHRDVAEMLLAGGARINEPFSPCARAGHLGVTPLMAAAGRGDTRMVELLLSRGADASAEAGELAVFDAGVTALYLAEVRGHRDAAAALQGGCAAKRRLWKYLVLGLWGGAWVILRPRAGAPRGERDGQGRF